MIRWFIHRKLNAVERQLGVSIDYVRHIVKVSLPTFFKFAKMFSVANCRCAVPVSPFSVASVVGAKHADCGTCVQIAVNQAKQAGVPSEHIRAVLDGDAEHLPQELAEVYRFARGVVLANGEEDAYRESLRKRYGERGLIELSMSVAAGVYFPTLKRGLGYAQTCCQVNIDV